MERILVGVDGSAPSLRAVDFAADLASKYNAELIVLTVVPHFWPQGSIPRSRNTRDWSISRAPQPSSFARPPIICLSWSFRLDFYWLYPDQSRVNFPVADAFELANFFFAASIALSRVRADRMMIERWQQRKSFSFLGISLMKHTR